MSKKNHKFTEIQFDDKTEFYFFTELDENDKKVEVYHNINKDDLSKYRDKLVNKKKPSKKDKESELDQVDSMVDSLLSQSDYNSKNESSKTDSELPERVSNIPKINFSESKSKSDRDARNLLKNVLNFYLSEEYISDNKYIQAKVAIDQLTLSGLLNQVKMSESAINRLMESIDNGEAHPRMFEVLAGLQRVYIDLLKTQTMSVVHIEEHMKKLKNDFDVYQGNQIPEKSKSSSDEEGDTYKGTRSFLKDLEDVDYEEDDSDNENNNE